MSNAASPKTYLVCVDGSAHSDHALAWVAAHARAASKVILFSCFAPVASASVTLAPGAIPPQDFLSWSKEETKARQAQCTAVVKASKNKLLTAENNLVVSADVREFVAETGDVRDAILELAEQEKVSAIVVGSRGLSAVKRFILGSTSSYLVTHAPCPVIVCRLKSDS